MLLGLAVANIPNYYVMDGQRLPSLSWLLWLLYVTTTIKIILLLLVLEFLLATTTVMLGAV